MRDTNEPLTRAAILSTPNTAAPSIHTQIGAAAIAQWGGEGGSIGISSALADNTSQQRRLTTFHPVAGILACLH